MDVIIEFEPLMTKVTRFLGREHTCSLISLPAAVSLIYQATPVVPTVLPLNDYTEGYRLKPSIKMFLLALMSRS